MTGEGSTCHLLPRGMEDDELTYNNLGHDNASGWHHPIHKTLVCSWDVDALSGEHRGQASNEVGRWSLGGKIMRLFGSPKPEIGALRSYRGGQWRLRDESD